MPDGLFDSPLFLLVGRQVGLAVCRFELQVVSSQRVCFKIV